MFRSSFLSASIFVLALTTFSLTACSSDDGGGSSAGGTQPIKIMNSKPGLGAMVILGDSLAAGAGRSSADAKVPEQCLKDEYNQAIINLAVPGLTSAEILAKVANAVQGKPTLIFVSSGGNDAIMNYYQPGSYAASKTMTEMETMFDALLDSGALVVYLGLKPALPGSERLSQITELANKKGVLVVDGMNGLWNDPTMMADQFHPNNAGYAKMCDRILAAVRGHYP